MASAAIYYHPEAYSISGPKLMGRNAAGESFLRGFLLHNNTNEYWLQVENTSHAKSFVSAANQFGKSHPVKVIDKNSLGALSNPGVVYYPGPGLGDHAWLRAFYGHDKWSLCGITHTTSSANAMDAITSLLTSPVQPWDAIICTSHAVKTHVSRLLQAQADYLLDRLGIQKLVLPQLPVIPLGIHTEDFVFNATQKARAREQLGIDQDTLVVLFMGRLSFHAKAHPLAMYQALEKAEKSNPDKKIMLIECGWHANEFIQKAYQNAGQLACPSVPIVTLDGREAINRNNAWACADIFCSLSDNIQETFGIVPIEAMAAGLPVVVSDWDGYKDTVRDGIDGFRIPTTMPSPGLGGDLALRHALEIDTYDMYCGHTCTLISVDIEATASAFDQLFKSKEMRQAMGEAGKKRAQEIFDWKHIIPQYESLWDQQNEIRKSQKESSKQLSHPWPARMDPFASFSHYPSVLLSPDSLLALVDESLDMAIKRLSSYRALAMVDFAKIVLPTEEESLLLLAQLGDGAKKASELIVQVPKERAAFVFRSITWFLKLGIIKKIL